MPPIHPCISQLDLDFCHLRRSHPVLARLVIKQAAVKRKRACEQPKGDDPHCKNIGCRGVATFIGFWCDVLVGAKHVLRLRALRSPFFHSVEVYQLHCTRNRSGRSCRRCAWWRSSVKHHVLELQILVNEAVRVKLRYCRQEFSQNCLGLVGMQALLGSLRECLVQICASCFLHDDVVCFFILYDLVDTCHPWAVRDIQHELRIAPPSYLVILSLEAFVLPSHLDH
mmetsp:Transcript_58364/g.104859  ORF Transcript_58364/g.104859 Transcript_58364/m.104859 type:complete len:226 (-) Transcript_58364:430-1107(-)